MSVDSFIVSPSSAGVGSAVLGIGAGYVFAPRKYSLERLLMQNTKSFERNFSPEKMKTASVLEKVSVANIHDASRVYAGAGSKILKDEVVPNAKLWHEMVKSVEVEDKFVKAVTQSKEAYLEALQKEKYIDLRTKLRAAQANALKNPKNAHLNAEMKAAANDFARAQIALEAPAKLYRDSVASLRIARENAIRKLPDKGRSINAQWDKVKHALSERANVMYEKLATLSKDKKLNKDYTAIKKYIPKARTTSAIFGGILAGITGLIAGLYAYSYQKHS